MKKLLMIISLLLLVFTAGCSKQQAADVPASPAADVAYSVTDDAGRTLHFEHKPQRIVSLTYGTDEILTDLVDIKRIMAYSRWAGDSEISFITKEQAYTVGRKVPENTEAVYALQPDLVVASTATSSDLVRSLEGLGVPVYIARSPHNYKGDVRQNPRHSCSGRRKAAGGADGAEDGYAPAAAAKTLASDSVKRKARCCSL